MINLNSIQTVVTRSLGRTSLILSKKSPEILLGLGVVSVVTGTVLACKATLKVNTIIRDTKDKLEEIKIVQEEESSKEIVQYSEEDAQKDTAILYIQTSVKLARLYLPAIIFTSAGIAMIFGSHHILSKRNAAIAAAYKMVDEAFKQYRQRVLDEYGEDADKKLRFGQKELTIIEKNKNGKEKEVTKKVLGTKDSMPFSFVFSEQTSSQYQRSYDLNIHTLRSAQLYANELLTIRGYVFLNEILDNLGMERTKEGQIIGWVNKYNPHNPNNDRYVRFGIEDPVNEEVEDPYKAMIQPFYLNFNVDGNMYDLI